MTSNNHPTPSHHQHRQRLTRPIRLLTVLLGLALVTSTAACSDEPVAYFTPPPSTPTPTQIVDDEPEVFERPDIRTIAVPQYPQAANEVSEDGARAFAHYFLDILNYTAATGDVTHLEKISGPECRFCESFAETTAQISGEEKWTVGFDFSFSDEPRTAYNSGLAFGFETQTSSAEYEVWSQAGLDEVVPAQDLNDGALIIYRLGDSWLVEQFGKRGAE